MSSRSFIEKNKPLVAVVAVLLVGLAGWRIYSFFTSQTITHETDFWVYDLSTGEISMGHEGDNPPFPLPSGGTGVMATLFSCTDCKDKDSVKVSVLFKYSDEMRAALERGIQQSDMRILTSPKSELVASVDMAAKGEWLTAESARDRLVREAVSVCGDNYVVCRP